MMGLCVSMYAKGGAAMESKQSQFWNAVSVAAILAAGLLTGYIALLIVGEFPR